MAAVAGHDRALPGKACGPHVSCVLQSDECVKCARSRAQSARPLAAVVLPDVQPYVPVHCATWQGRAGQGRARGRARGSHLSLAAAAVGNASSATDLVRAAPSPAAAAWPSRPSATGMAAAAAVCSDQVGTQTCARTRTRTRTRTNRTDWRERHAYVRVLIACPAPHLTHAHRAGQGRAGQGRAGTPPSPFGPFSPFWPILRKAGAKHSKQALLQRLKPNRICKIADPRMRNLKLLWDRLVER